MDERTVRVEVVYATLEDQCLLELDVPPGTTAGEAVRLSGIEDRYPGLDTSSIGIFGEHVRHDRRLVAGDRVEIYRPLVADPREARRELARQGRTMKRRR